VLRAPGVKPKSLLVGVMGAKSVASLHPKYMNLDHLAFARRKILKEVKIPNTIEGLNTWQAASDEHGTFVRKSSLTAGEGYFLLSQPWMAEALSGWTAALSTDAVEGFISSPANASLLCTVGYSEHLERVVPLQVTVILGKTAKHYQHHFEALFTAMDLAVSHKGLIDWAGMVVDFSGARLKGFHNALADYILKKAPSLTPDEAAKLTDNYVVVSTELLASIVCHCSIRRVATCTICGKSSVLPSWATSCLSPIRQTSRRSPRSCRAAQPPTSARRTGS
jgi:hypothetical protein